MPHQESSDTAKSDSLVPSRKQLSAADLKTCLVEHKTWLDTDGQNGAKANFQDADLSLAARGGLLSGAVLQKAELQNAQLSGIALANAAFDDANLQEANLSRSNLERAVFFNADLKRADLASAKMEKTQFSNADLSNADLCDVDLRSGICRNSRFRNAQFKRAALAKADFCSADFRDANLLEADLSGASLEFADLKSASLNKVEFDGLIGKASDLTNADLRDADLSDAKLSTVIGLRTSALGGANVSNAKLPEDIAKFEGLEHVAEISRSARPVFLAVVGACVYSWLTIGTTTDPALVTNLAATPLPIIQTEIPIAFFYWAGPIILLALYAYLHMYLQRLWIGLASLPAIFTDGKPLDERAYPWLLTSLVRAYVPRLRTDRPPLWWLQVATSLFAAWALVPLTLLAYWLRYMPRRDWVGIIIIGLALITAVWMAVAMYRIMRDTLGLSDHNSSWKVWPEWAAATSTAALLLAGSLSLMNASIPVHTPLVRNYADLFGQNVSRKSDEWRDSAQNLDLVVGARLVGRDLSFAYARQAFLVKADLESANLSGADLTAANLWSANLHGATLHRTELERAQLNDATLINANLRGADLVGANLIEADLIGADLAGANLSFANLQRANLDGANLTGAILVGAKLGAAILKGADLSAAILSNTDRGGNDLLPVEGLNGEQLNEACGNEATRLPIGLFIGPCR